MPIKTGTVLPAFQDATEWIGNSHELLKAHTGPVFVHFWARSCPSCKANMPEVQNLRAKYEPLGLVTIAVHMPMNESDLDISMVKKEIEELGITEVCAIDNTHTIGQQFEVIGYPTYFIFTNDRKLKRHAAGAFGLSMVTRAIENIFDEQAGTLLALPVSSGST